MIVIMIGKIKILAKNPSLVSLFETFNTFNCMCDVSSGPVNYVKSFQAQGKKAKTANLV